MITERKKIEIIQKDNPILRKTSAEIPVGKIKSTEVKKIISDLKKAIKGQADAVAISAVQIAKPIRLFVISKRAFQLIEPDATEIKQTKDLIFINPKITKTSKTKQELEEGCLSVRYIYGQVIRSEKVTIEALDEDGKKFSRGFSGFLAQVVQHETDHLNGILFIDTAENLHEVSHEEYEKSLKELANN